VADKFIVIVGGVISGVGKGIATASIGKILQKFGYIITAVKIDPYINYDAGTLRPTEHGEVWVTYDGGEVDQDLGNYERFLGIHLSRYNNITTGQVYDKIIKNERKGKYLGETVQFIPHVPDEIIDRIKIASKDSDICLIEIGGTVGDYENIPFLFAVKSLEKELSKDNVLYVLVSYMPIPSNIGEMKTKPTQQAIKLLNEHGIFPDIILCRGEKPLDDIRRKKIETYANIASEFVISAPDEEILYAIPLNFEKEQLGNKILSKLKLKKIKSPDFLKWEKLVNYIRKPDFNVNVAMVGKYVNIGEFSLKDSYISVNQSLDHAGAHLHTGIKIDWIEAEDIDNYNNAERILSKYNGIVVPGGFGLKGVNGKINAIRYARENKTPYLGLCYGLQLAIVEYSRNVLGIKDANTTENDPDTKNPVIDIIKAQKKIIAESRYGNTMRLGAYCVILKKNSLIYTYFKDMNRIYNIAGIKNYFSGVSDKEKRIGIINSDENNSLVIERHRHRYEVNPNYIERLSKNNLKITGYHRMLDGTILVEFIELDNHPYFVATQAHPEFESSLENPSPLFYGFVKNMLKKS
jgi:CTP synthase